LDGHLRRDLDPDMEVDVEVLDVTEDEARKLLLTIDPLAALTLTQGQIQERLPEITPVDEAEFQELWARESQKLLAAEPGPERRVIAEQFLILVTCWDEEEQVAMVGRLMGKGLKYKRWRGEGGGVKNGDILVWHFVGNGQVLPRFREE
jgi:hypothetical protein